MFQKRHYEAFALMLFEAGQNPPVTAESMRQRIGAAMVEMFKRDNPRFRAGQFCDRAALPEAEDDNESTSWQAETYAPGRGKRRPYKPLSEMTASERSHYEANRRDKNATASGRSPRIAG